MDPFNIKASLKALAASKRQEPSSYQQPPQEEPRDPIQKLGGRIQKDIVKEAPPGLLERAGGTALSGLATVGNLLDVPGSMVRDVATWLPGGPKPANPFDQLVSPFTHHNRTTGRDLLRGYGLAGKEDTMGNFTTGIGAEIAMDPLTYLTFGASALTRGGRAAKALNMMDDAPEIASRLLNRRVGKREARHVVTPRMLLDNPKLGVETKLKLQDRLQKMGVTEKDMDRQLGGLAKINMPFSNKPFKFGDKPFTFWGLTDEEGIIGAGKARGRGPDFLNPVQHNVPDPEDFGPSGGSALGGDGPDIPPTQGPAPDFGDMPDSPIAPVNPKVPPSAGPAAGAPVVEPPPVAPSATINAKSHIQPIDANNYGVVAEIPDSQSRARATLTYASEADETPMLFISGLEKQPGSPKGSGRALINSMVEKVKDRNPMGVAGNFDTHDQLGAFASVFGKDNIRFLDRTTGQPVDIPFAEANKTPSKYTAVHYFMEPPKAAAKVETPQYKPEEIEASRQLGYEIEDIPRSYNEMAADIKSNPVRLLAAESAVGNLIDMVSKEGTPLIQALDQLEWNVDLEFDRLGFGKPSPAEIEYARRGLSIIDRPLNMNDLIEYGKAKVADARKGEAQAEAERIFKKYGSFDMDEGLYYRAVLGEAPKPKKQKALIDKAPVESPAIAPSSQSLNQPDNIPPSALQPDLMTPEVVKEAKKRGRKPKATPEPQVATPAPTQPMSAMEAMQAEAGIKPTTPPDEIALKSQALLQEVANKRGASDAEVAEMLLRGDTASAIRRLETKPLDGLKIDGLMSAAKKNGILTDEQADAILNAIPQKYKGGMSILDQAKQVSDNLASKSKLESQQQPVSIRVDTETEGLGKQAELLAARGFTKEEIDVIDAAYRNMLSDADYAGDLSGTITLATVPKDRLIQTQEWRNKPAIKGSKHPLLAMEQEGELYLKDGHHRLDGSDGDVPVVYYKPAGDFENEGFIQVVRENQNRLEAQGGIPGAAGIAPTKVDLNTLEGLPEQARPIVGDMINKIGQKLFDDVQLQVGGTGSRTTTAGDIDMSTGFIKVYDSAIKNGTVDKTTVHEFWHHLSKYISPDEVRAVRNEFEQAVAAFKKTEGNKPLPYELSSVDEFFAHKLTDLSMKYLGREKPVDLIGKVWAKALDAFEYIWDAIRQTLGYDETKRIMNSFLDGHRAEVSKYTDATMTQRLMDDLEPGNVLRSEAEPPNLISPERIQRMALESKNFHQLFGDHIEYLRANDYLTDADVAFLYAAFKNAEHFNIEASVRLDDNIPYAGFAETSSIDVKDKYGYELNGHNKIKLNRRQKIDRARILLHELGHIAYHNMDTAMRKVAWDALKRFIETREGMEYFQKIYGDKFFDNKKSFADYFMANSGEAFAQMFADHLTRRAIKNDSDLLSVMAKMWEKVADIITSVLGYNKSSQFSGIVEDILDHAAGFKQDEEVIQSILKMQRSLASNASDSSRKAADIFFGSEMHRSGLKHGYFLTSPDWHEYRKSNLMKRIKALYPESSLAEKQALATLIQSNDTPYSRFFSFDDADGAASKGTFDPKSSNILEAQGGKASGAKMAPTKVDLNTLEGLPEQARPIVGDMINKIGQKLFDDVTMEVGGDAAKAVTTGDIDMDTGFIRIYNSAIESGIVDKTTVHELWHHLSKYITPEEVRTVQKEFDDAVKAHQGPLPYELSSIDEYFAHKLTDLTMKYLGREKPASVIGSVWAKALDVFEHIWDAIRQTLGYDQTKKIMYSFLDGYRADAVKLSDSTLQQRLVGDVEINGNILDSQVDPIIPNRDIAGQLAQAKSAIMGKSLDDIGQSILDSAVGRTMTALLDQSALGQLTKAGIEAARLSWKGYREGVFKEREYMSHHLRTWYDLPNIREDIIMDEELGSLDEFITAAGGDKALGAKNRMIAARKIQNGRVNDLRRLLEKPMYDEEGKFIPGSFRVEEQELPAWVGQEKVNGQVVDNPSRRQQVAQMFSSWRLKNAQILGDERKEGIVASLVNGYFARLVSNLPGNNRSLWNPNYGKILDPTHPNVKRRKDWFVGYDDGTSVINDISVDAELSGAHARKLVREQISPAEIRQYGNILWERYKDRLMGSHSQMTYGELAQTDPKAFAKINKLTEEIMNLDPRHVEYQIPLFSNDLFSAMELRLEHHHRSIMHAKAIQHLIKKNATARNLIGGDGRGITLNELLKESKYDSKSARHIMEVGTRGETSLVADKHFWDQEIQPRINEVIRHYQAETAHYLRNPTHEVGTATGVAPYTDPGGRAFQVLPYEGDGIRRLVFPQFFDKKVPDVPNHVMKLEVNLDNPAETMVTWYDQVDDGANFVGESLSKILDNPTNVASRGDYVSGLPLYALFDQITVPQDVGDAITKFVQGPRTLEEVKPIVRGYDKATNMWKMMQTGMLPFIGFHGRNFGSGQASNFYLGIQNDPRFKFKLSDPTTYLNPIRSFVQPIVDAHKIATGQTIKGAASMPQFAGMNLTDEAATEALRREMYAQGITGEKQGLSAEQLTDTVGTAASQFPGIDKAKSINPLAWQWSKPAEDSTFAQRWLMPWLSKGVMSDADIFRPGQLGRDLGGYTEALNRLAPYIAMRRQGFDPKAAAREVNRAQVDYTNLSNFNREYTRRLFPFASYTLGMTPTVFGELASRPGGGMGRTVMATTSAGQSSEQGVTPDYIRETASIPLGMSEDGTRSYITGFGLPFEDPLQFAQLARGNVSGVLRELGSRMNPVPKSLIEIMTGRSLYQAGPFGGREIEDLDPTIGRIIANINDLATGEKTEKAEPFLGNPWAEYLIANAGPGRMLNTARTITDPRKWDTIPWKLALNLGTGVRVADVSPSAQDAILRERLARVMKDFGGRMYTRPYFPDYAKEDWTPQEAEDAAKIDALLKLLGQRAKDRRVQ